MEEKSDNVQDSSLNGFTNTIKEESISRDSFLKIMISLSSGTIVISANFLYQNLKSDLGILLFFIGSTVEIISLSSMVLSLYWNHKGKATWNFVNSLFKVAMEKYKMCPPNEKEEKEVMKNYEIILKKWEKYSDISMKFFKISLVLFLIGIVIIWFSIIIDLLNISIL